MKAELTYSESNLDALGEQIARVLCPGDRVLLEGQMGAGKTTLTRSILKFLQIHQPPEGSPSFAIAHEYSSPSGDIVHMDFYRIRAEAEIEEAGILSYFWERPLIIITEWLSLWPELESKVIESGRSFRIDLEATSDPFKRVLRLDSPTGLPVLSLA